MLFKSTQFGNQLKLGSAKPVSKEEVHQEKEMPQSERQKVLDDPAVQLLQKGLDAQIIDVKEE